MFVHVRILTALGRHEEAVGEYLAFVDEFPEGEFRQAAQEELSSLGLLPVGPALGASGLGH